MLSLSYDNIDIYRKYRDEVKPINETILSPRVRQTIRLGNPADKTPDVYTLPSDEYEMLPAPPPPIDTFGYPREGANYKPQLEIGNVLGLSLTDKSSRGVFEDRPLISRDSVFSRIQDFEASNRIPPENATLLRNPAVEGFETMYTGESPLGANFEDRVAVASGQDNAAFYLQDTEPQPAYPLGDPRAARDKIMSELGLGNPLMFFTDKDVRNQTFIFIIGAIVLGLGIFALTR